MRPSLAQNDDDTRGAGATPPRLAAVDGDVSFWRPGAEDWAPAARNTPLAPGDAVYTGDGASAVVQLGGDAGVRLAGGTEVEVETLEPAYLQLKASSGRLAMDLGRLRAGQTIEVDTPNAAFTIERPGYYRFDVDGETTNFVTRRGGTATMVPAGGDESEVGPDRLVVVTGTETAQVSTDAAPPPDDWDRQSVERERAPAPSESRRYVPEDVAGGDDLDRYGSWHEAPRYGRVWVPRDVAPDWSPYSTGHWIWDPYYGWTWVDDAPWGWAPYHYGRWVYLDSYWGWAPGPVVATAVYAPALVAFFGPSVGVSVSVGFPFVSWVALGFGEPVIPWWGRPGFIGHCWWGGWDGPRIVNNVVIDRRTFVNVRNVNVYRNMGARNAVIAVHRDRFGRGPLEHRALDKQTISHLRPVHGQLPVRPSRESLVVNPGHGRRPPEHVLSRPVVARHQPQDVTPRLRAAGLADHVRPGGAPSPQPRLVRPVERPQDHGVRRAGPPTAPAVPGGPGQRAGHATMPAEGGPRHVGPNAGGAPQTPPPPQRHVVAPREQGGGGRSLDRSPHAATPAPQERQRSVDVPRATPPSPYGRDVRPAPRQHEMAPRREPMIPRREPVAPRSREVAPNHAPAPRSYTPAPRSAPPMRGGAPMHDGGGMRGGGAPPRGGPSMGGGAPARPPSAPQAQPHEKGRQRGEHQQVR